MLVTTGLTWLDNVRGSSTRSHSFIPGRGSRVIGRFGLASSLFGSDSAQGLECLRLESGTLVAEGLLVDLCLYKLGLRVDKMGGGLSRSRGGHAMR